MSEREKILGRIREALKVEAHVPGTHGHGTKTVTTSTSSQWLPLVGKTVEEQFALFAQNCSDLKTTFHLVNSVEEARQVMVTLRDAEKWQRIAAHSGDLTNAICPPLNLPLLRTDKSYDAVELENCDVGISECDAIIAQTGSVLVTNRSAGGRALSVLPPHHIVLARREQLIADLPAAYELLKKKYGGNYPSMISFITGPSRTGDIERILVLGAHGPKKLTVICF